MIQVIPDLILIGPQPTRDEDRQLLLISKTSEERSCDAHV
jgi:hypothetical protein